jgi:hypothetical protein
VYAGRFGQATRPFAKAGVVGLVLVEEAGLVLVVTDDAVGVVTVCWLTVGPNAS